MLKIYFYCLTILDTNIIYNSIACILSFTRQENIAITACENYSREHHMIQKWKSDSTRWIIDFTVNRSYIISNNNGLLYKGTLHLFPSFSVVYKGGILLADLDQGNSQTSLSYLVTVHPESSVTRHFMHTEACNYHIDISDLSRKT